MLLSNGCARHADCNPIARCGELTGREIDTYERMRSFTIEFANSFRPGPRSYELLQQVQGFCNEGDLDPVCRAPECISASEAVCLAYSARRSPTLS